MPTLTLPQAGKSASNATVLRWCKKVGDAVGKGEVLLQVETDSGLAEIESAIEGILREVLAPAGKTIPVGAPLAVIDTPALASSNLPHATPNYDHVPFKHSHRQGDPDSHAQGWAKHGGGRPG
jgi:pyruvate/2-oxoglutarate dehydrogenase complex dihydrolipoamide acyltransferase (E2) component